MARLLKFGPIPIIIAEICTANIGGLGGAVLYVWRLIHYIIVGTAFGYTFTDFAINTGPILFG